MATFIVFGMISANAQTNLTGKYNYKDSTAEGNPMDSTLEIKSKNFITFTYVSTDDDYETKERTGT